MKARTVIIVTLFTSALTFAYTGVGRSQSPTPPLKIGTYDSRALALAYWRSDDGLKRVSDLRERYEQAKADNDKQRMKQLEVEGPGLQVRMHQQVFSTGSVTDIIKRVETGLPAIAKEAGLALIVSKWQVAYKAPSVQYIDVTPQLVKLLNPSDAVRKMIEELCKNEPVAIEDLSMDPKK